jgi:hypothetical protein
MDETSWAQQAVDRFFEGRKCPTQPQCDQIARSISGASNVYNVDTPGSMSYTVVCKLQDDRGTAKQGTVVSFREPQAHLDQSMVELAQAIHGPLVPKVSQHGSVDGADPPLAIYTMPYLPGISCFDALDCQVDMDDVTEAKHVCFVRHLARFVSYLGYKSTCRLPPRPMLTVPGIAAYMCQTGTLLDVGSSRNT